MCDYSERVRNRKAIVRSPGTRVHELNPEISAKVSDNNKVAPAYVRKTLAITKAQFKYNYITVNAEELSSYGSRNL
jgi:hypothetical protein